MTARSSPITVLLATACGLVACSGGGDAGIVTAPIVVTVTPDRLSLREGDVGTITVAASGGRQGATLPTLSSCQSSAVAVARVAVEGSTCRVTAVAPGEATVNAVLSNGLAGQSQVSVSALPRALTELRLTGGAVVVGQTLALTPAPVTGGAAVSVTYRYRTSAAAVATVDSVRGIVTGVSPGTATITVTGIGSGTGFRTDSASTSATVTVAPLPQALTGLTVSGGSVRAGSTLSLAPNAVLASPAVSVIYSYVSSAPTVATVDATTGEVTGVAAGTAVVTVTARGSGSGFAPTTLTATATIVVTALPDAVRGVTLTPGATAVLIGELVRLTAVPTPGGTAVTVVTEFASSAAAVATVNATTGLVTAIGPGTATITATATGRGTGFTSNAVTATATITVSTATLGLTFGNEQFVTVPGGTYSRGSFTGNADEQPVRPVLVNRFAVQKTEVTQAQWRQVMAGTPLANPSAFASCGDRCPVERVSWEDVQQFLTRLNQQDPGKGYRLPTEAEWEYAARGGTSTDLYAAGRTADELGWIASNSGNRTSVVGQKIANAYGLYDVIGNVWEWASDWYSATFYGTGTDANPAGPATGTERVIRGSSWFFPASAARMSWREKFPPASKTDALGFRLVRTAP
jgi:formylglycine-generating enzyme required for sulfatase activity